MSIQLKRGTSTVKASSSATLDAGQPFYETDTGKLYIAKAKDTLVKKNASLVNAYDPDAAHIDTTNTFKQLVTVDTADYYGLWVECNGSPYKMIELHVGDPSNSTSLARVAVRGGEANRYTEYQHNQIKMMTNDTSSYSVTLPSMEGKLALISDVTAYHALADSAIAIKSSRDNTVTNTATNIFYGNVAASVYPFIKLNTVSGNTYIEVGGMGSDSSGNPSSTNSSSAQYDSTGITFKPISSINYRVSLPAKSGIIAVTSDLPSNIDLSISKALSTTSQAVTISSSNLTALRDTSSNIKTITLKVNTSISGSSVAAKYILYKAGIGSYNGTAGFGFMYIGFTENGKMIKLSNVQQDDDDTVNVVLV